MQAMTLKKPGKSGRAMRGDGPFQLRFDMSFYAAATLITKPYGVSATGQ
jgi:hypothetical protein